MGGVSPWTPAVGRIQGITGVQQDPLRRAVEIVVVVLDLHAVAVNGDFLQQPFAARAVVRAVGISRSLMYWIPECYGQKNRPPVCVRL